MVSPCDSLFYPPPPALLRIHTLVLKRISIYLSAQCRPALCLSNIGQVPNDLDFLSRILPVYQYNTIPQSIRKIHTKLLDRSFDRSWFSPYFYFLSLFTQTDYLTDYYRFYIYFLLFSLVFVHFLTIF